MGLLSDNGVDFDQLINQTRELGVELKKGRVMIVNELGGGAHVYIWGYASYIEVLDSVLWHGARGNSIYPFERIKINFTTQLSFLLVTIQEDRGLIAL